MRTVTLDLECTSLKADVGRILCGSFLDFHTEEITSFRIDADRAYDDRTVCKEIRDHLSQYNLVVGWNILGFDLPYLQTRLAANNMNKIDRLFYTDLMYSFRGWHGLKPRNSKLSTVAEFFKLPERKDALDVEVWTKAQAGHERSLNRLVKRCESDVRLTHQIWKKALDFDGVIAKIKRYGQ